MRASRNPCHLFRGGTPSQFWFRLHHRRRWVRWPRCARLAFDTLRIIAPWGGTGVPRRYFADEHFYLRDRSDTGVLGSSRLQRAPMVLQQALSVQGFATYLWDNAGTPTFRWSILAS